MRLITDVLPEVIAVLSVLKYLADCLAIESGFYCYFLDIYYEFEVIFLKAIINPVLSYKRYPSLDSRFQVRSATRFKDS